MATQKHQHDAAQPAQQGGAMDVGHFLRLLDLSQVQVAALLALTPQAVSKGLSEDGLAYLGGGGRAQRLFQALVYIGGDRYVRSAARLRELGRSLGWGGFDAEITDRVPAHDVYAQTEEMWVISDAPDQVLDWDAFKAQMLSPADASRPKVVVFFLRTLEAAERWAEVLERELVRPATQDGSLSAEQVAVSGAYIFLVVSNALAYSQDFVITDPGSRCIDVLGVARTPTVHLWSGAAYVRSRTQNLGFVRLVRALELGASSNKANFFPLGTPLRSDILDFRHRFIDGLIAKRGERHEDQQSGELMAGGILSDAQNRAANTLEFNKRSKFTPVFILAYKRRPGDGPSERTLRLIHEELVRAKEHAVEIEQKDAPRADSFW
jgi:hypothetical protein